MVTCERAGLATPDTLGLRDTAASRRPDGIEVGPYGRGVADVKRRGKQSLGPNRSTSQMPGKVNEW